MTILVTLEVDGVRAHIEYVERGGLDYVHRSYVARIFLREPTWDATGSWMTDSGIQIVKSFGNGVRAEDWLLDCLSNPSYLYLKYT
jgi:hypothetical protein